MVKQLRRFSLAMAALAVFATTTPEVKADLTGATLQWQYWAYGGAYNSPASFVVAPGILGTFIDSSIHYFDIYADGTSITLDYRGGNQTASWSPSALSLAPTIYNGISFDVLAGPTITGVSIDASTNMVGFDASRISYTGSQIQVDWMELPFVAGETIVKLNIRTESVAVPEPSTLAASGTLLVLGGLIGWRRRRVAA